MGIDAVGGTGDQGAVVLPLFNAQVIQLIWLYGADLIHLVGQGLVQNPQNEGIPLCQLVQIGEQLGAGQTPVAGQDAVGPRPAGGQGGAFNMAHSNL